MSVEESGGNWGGSGFTGGSRDLGSSYWTWSGNPFDPQHQSKGGIFENTFLLGPILKSQGLHAFAFASFNGGNMDLSSGALHPTSADIPSFFSKKQGGGPRRDGSGNVIGAG